MSFNICKSGSIVKSDKFWELQITNEFEGPYFNFGISWTRKCDHAGFRVLFEVMSFMFDFKIYDNRHWDYETKRYMD